MDIDEYISNKRSDQSKIDLEEAKRRLAEEKRRLRDEERKMMELEKTYDNPPNKRVPGQPMQPWMVWNLIILFLVLLTFVINLSVALLHEHTPVASESGLAKTATGAAVTQTKQGTTGNSTTTNPAPVPTTQIIQTNLSTTQNAEPTPDFDLFLLYDKDLPADPSAPKADPLPQGGIIINGTDTIYYNIVLRSKEKDNLRCDADRTTILNQGKDTDTKYYSGIKMDPFEKEELPNSVRGVGDVEVDWEFQCRFEGYLAASKKKAKFSLTIEGG